MFSCSMLCSLSCQIKQDALQTSALIVFLVLGLVNALDIVGAVFSP